MPSAGGLEDEPVDFPLHVVDVQYKGWGQTVKRDVLRQLLEEPLREAKTLRHLNHIVEILKKEEKFGKLFRGATFIEVEVDVKKAAQSNKSVPIAVSITLPEAQRGSAGVDTKTGLTLSGLSVTGAISRPNLFGNLESLIGGFEIKPADSKLPFKGEFQFSKPLRYYPARDLHIGASSGRSGTLNYDLHSHQIKVGISQKSKGNEVDRMCEYMLSARTLTPLKQANMEVRESAALSIKSSLIYTVKKDTRNISTISTEGYLAEVKHELAGLFGDARFYRFGFKGEHYTLLLPNVVLKSSLTSSFVVPIGHTIRVQDKCSLPLNLWNTDLHNPGTDYAATGNLEFITPVASQVVGRFFVNLGVGANVDKDATVARNIQAAKLGTRLSLGFGFRYDRYAIEFGFPILRQSKDIFSWMNFSAGAVW